MKILAIEKELPGCDWSNAGETLEQEARVVYQLSQRGVIREIYFTGDKKAVVVLECSSMSSAADILATLPLVKKQMISFSLMELHPYTGFDRIINSDIPATEKTTLSDL